MIDTTAPPTAKEVFSSLPPERLERSTPKGVAIFLGATALWATFLAKVVLADSLLLKVAASLALGLWLAILLSWGTTPATEA